MIKKVIILPDVHLDTYFPKPYLPVRKFISKFKPDEILIIGDFMNMSSFNHHEEQNLRYMENKRYKKEIDFVNKELDYLQKYSKKITYLDANHEDWCKQYINKHPQLEGLIEYQKLLKLKERKIKWLPYNVPYKIGKCNFIHGLYTGENHAKKTAMKVGKNIVYAHVHSPQSYLLGTLLNNPIMSYSLGCLCEKEQDYNFGKFPNWMNGFAVMYYDEKGFFNLYPINIINRKFIFNGKQYK